MTLHEIRRNKRSHKENHNPNMEETTTATVIPSRDIAAGGALNTKNFKSGCGASEAKFQTKQKSCKSNFDFHAYRAVCGDKVTVTFDKKTNSKYNGDTLVEPVRVGHAVIKAPTQTRGKDKSSYSIPKKLSLVSDCLPLKQTEDGLRNVGDGKNFLVSESNRNEKFCFEQTDQIMSETERKPRIRQLKRKSTDPANGPPPKRPRLEPPTADSLQDSEVTHQVNGCSYLSKLNGKPYLESGESCLRLGQAVTDISEDTFKPCFVLLVNKSSSISFNTAGRGAAQSTDPSSQTTSPLITSELSGKHPGLGNVIRVTHTSKSQSSQRLESKLALSTTSEKCVLDDKMEELSLSRTELRDMDEELLLALDDDDDTSMTLNNEEDILLQI
jgi:hypothetical protein